jgi:hypothetical protein
MLTRHDQTTYRGKRGMVANTYLEAYTKNKDFILVAAYMNHDREVGRYASFSDKRSDDDDEPEIVHCICILISFYTDLFCCAMFIPREAFTG